MTQSHSLIEELCADAKVTSGSLSRHYWTVLVSAALPIALIGLWIFHLAGASVRPDYFDLITNSGVALKQLIPLMILLTGAPIIIMLMRPETRLSGNILPLVAALSILPIMMVWTLAPLTGEARLSLIQGDGFVQCLLSISALSVGLIAAQITVLRNGAVTKPIAAGAIAGAAAGAISAIIYAFICTEDSPAFYGLWYTVGILFAGSIGAAAGKIFLKW